MLPSFEDSWADVSDAITGGQQPSVEAVAYETGQAKQEAAERAEAAKGQIRAAEAEYLVDKLIKALN